MSEKKVLVIAGPSGAGESTITQKIIKKYPIFQRLVTATTRQPRLKEKNKIDYYFFDNDQFQDEIENGNIIEHTYIEDRNVYYGTYKPDLDKKIKKNINIIVNTDIIGAKYYKKNYNATTIFIMPESIDVIEKRLGSRDCLITKEELQKRLNQAKKEIKKESIFYDYIVINKENKLDETLEEMEKILKKEKYL